MIKVRFVSLNAALLRLKEKYGVVMRKDDLLSYPGHRRMDADNGEEIIMHDYRSLGGYLVDWVFSVFDVAGTEIDRFNVRRV